MKQFKLWNNIFGWVVFIISSIVFLLTIEPTASWWDCGEYIATAYKLQIGHPPGAPFFQLVGRFFSLFAFGDVTKVAMMINAMSALCSSATVMLLFWSITMLGLKFSDENKMSAGRKIAIIGSGLVGALAFTFSDSFWFSAVEGEVYAMSSFFTAFVFWAILKWDRVADQPHSSRWLILIAYFFGLSIGVHLLNLLAIPAIGLVIYFNKYKPTWKGALVTTGISFIVLAIINFGIVPYTVSLAGKFEIFTTNTLGMPFNTGTIIYLVLMLISIVWAIVFTHRDKHSKGEYLIGLIPIFIISLISIPTFIAFLIISGLYLWYKKSSRTFSRVKLKTVANTIVLSLAFILIGYSSFLILVIRSNANTPINENEPSDAVSLLSYLKREQYGSWPIVYGQYYNAPLDAQKPYIDGSPIYIKDRKSGKYLMTDPGENTQRNYDKRFCTIFPRMWSSLEERNHPETYKLWGKVKGVPITVTTRDGRTETLYKPTFGENLRYFFSYQLGHMYFRYFFWNYAGRQNDIQGYGGVQNGNWMSGIPIFDKHRVGDQSNLPDSMKGNPGHNKLYMLPLILGLIGMMFQMQKQSKGFWVVMLLFFMTGIAIILYLNSGPNEPRERDYAYVGSYYAFAIWIGLGVMAIWDWVKKINEKYTPIVITAALLVLVPGIMAKAGWDDHDRSNKYAARDFAVNYLNSCEPNAILITNGDNDTFPLWYAQEVEGVRTDVRVVNYMLAASDWYAHQLMRKVYNSEPLPFTLSYDDYNKGVNEVLYYIGGIDERIELYELMDFIKYDPKAKYRQGNATLTVYPAKEISIKVDSLNIIKNNLVPEKYKSQIVSSVEFNIKQDHLFKNDLLLLDFLANNNFKRPVYFANPLQIRSFDLSNYCHLEGVVYRFLPVEAGGASYYKGLGDVNTDKTYNILVENSKWGNINLPNVYADPQSRINAQMARQHFARLAMALVAEGKNDSAIMVCDRVQEIFPNSKIPYELYMVQFIEVYYNAGAFDKGNALAEFYLNNAEQDINYIQRQKPSIRKQYNELLNQSYAIIGHINQQAKKNNQTSIEKRTDEMISRITG